MWLLDCPALFDRPGNPYHDADGRAYADNAERFMLLCRVGALLAEDAFGLGWRPDVLHCNDWQSALVPLLLHARHPRPALVFTIHNLAYQGLFRPRGLRAARHRRNISGTPMRWSSTASSASSRAASCSPTA